MQPATAAVEAFSRSLYGNMPYSRPILGTEEALEQIDRDRITRFFRERVLPGRSSYRMVHAEGDALPGLVIDRLGGVLAVQLTTLGMDSRKPQLEQALRALGFETLLPDDLQAPIIVTFHMPADSKFDFAAFYDRLAAKGYVIYPGKLTVAPTFRIGCIGQMVKEDLEGALAVIREELSAMGVTQCGPAASAAE